MKERIWNTRVASENFNITTCDRVKMDVPFQNPGLRVTGDSFLHEGFGGALSLLMLRLYSFSVEVGKLLSCMIIRKLWFQDLPQQVCIVAYFHAWYSPNGMRCQRGLFHPSHWDNGYTLNLIAVIVLCGGR